MRNVILLSLLCCSFCLAQVSPTTTDRVEEEWMEPTRWETIHWQPDAATALRESQLSGKPLMVFMFVNYKGRPGETRA